MVFQIQIDLVLSMSKFSGCVTMNVSFLDVPLLFCEVFTSLMWRVSVQRQIALTRSGAPGNIIVDDPLKLVVP